MNILELVSFANRLTDQMRCSKSRYQHYFDGDLSVYKALSVAKEALSGDSGYDMVNYQERGIITKRLLLRLEYLLCKIKAFEEEGGHSKLIEKSFIESTTTEGSLLAKELHSIGYDDVSYGKGESIVGTQYESAANQLVELLLDSESPLVVPILGMPGRGKSALARRVFKDDAVQEYFDSCHWISMTDARSHEDLNRAVSKSISIKPNNDKKYLFVFDDLHNMEIFESLLRESDKYPGYYTFRNYAKKESKIIITSRLEPQRVAGVLGVSLPSLDNYESWKLSQDIVSKDHEILPILVPFSRQICQKCENIPGFIKIIASIISSKATIEEREHFLDVVLTSVPDPITTLSSAHVFINDTKERQRWFSWCSLLPTDYEFTKAHVFRLLKAQPFFKRETLDHQYFNELVRGGYFLECDSGNSIIRYKVSYLGHELMKYLAGDEFCLVGKVTTEPDYRIVRHLSFIVDLSWRPPSWLPKAVLLKSLLLWPRESGDFIPLPKIDLSLMTELRTLYFKGIHCISAPKFLAKCKKLKYLRIGAISISFPEDLRLIYLLKFSVLKKLTIQYDKCSGEEIQDIMEYLMVQPMKKPSFDGDERNLETLTPHQTLVSLEIYSWKGESLPKWAIDELSIFLSNMVSIQIAKCSTCRYLPAFSTLPHLTSLRVLAMNSLEEIIIGGDKRGASIDKTFYPSLMCLVLCDLPGLKGWTAKGQEPQQYSFPLLTQIEVRGCPSLISIPLFRVIVSVKATNIHDKLLKDLMCPQDSSLIAVPVNNSAVSGCSEVTDTEKEDLKYNTPLENLSLHWLTNLKVLPKWIGEFTRLRKVTIHYCLKLTELRGNFSALQQLDIRYCPRMIHFPESLPSLKKLRVQENCTFEDLLRASPNLEELEINDCDEQDWNTQRSEVDNSMGVWEGLQSLHTLKLIKMESLPNIPDFGKLFKLHKLFIQCCPNLTTLPDSLCTLPVIEHLHIKNCPRLTHLPQAFSNLKSLKHLELRGSPHLEKIYCRENWDLIRCIPDVIIGQWTRDSYEKTWRTIDLVDSELLDNDLQVARPSFWVAARKTLAKTVHLC